MKQKPIYIGAGVLILIAIAWAVLGFRNDEPPAPVQATRAVAPEPAQPVGKDVKSSDPAPADPAPAEPAPAEPMPAESLSGDGLLKIEDGRIEARASDPESMKAIIEQMRANPETAAVADEIEASLATYREMLDSGMDPGEAARVMEKAMADSLTKQIKASRGGEPRVRIRLN